MKLRNKKTGEIGEAHWITFREDGTDLCVSLHVNGIYEEVHSLAELNEGWEDYKPKEPLIKDEEIRKAVRVWAEACGIKRVYLSVINEEGSTFCIYKLSIDCYLLQIAVHDHGPIEGGKFYTITELCVEEEE